MFFIQPERDVATNDLLSRLDNVSTIALAALESIEQNLLVIADIDDYLNYQWTNPTVVVANQDDGQKIANAWQQGALATWIWQQLPDDLAARLQQIDRQYKRNQDSRDLPAAVEVQRCLLPDIYDIENYQIDIVFKPSTYLSGDWYDFWYVEENKFLFYLADVAGHGVASSLLTSWLAAFHGRAESPTQLLNKLNQMLVDHRIEKHITMLCGLLDLEQNSIEWCSAGHYPPALLFIPNQEPIRLKNKNLALGLTAEAEYNSQRFDMPVGSTLTFSSDGALETFEGGLQAQLEQLVTALAEGNFKLPSHVVDDVAILSLSRTN